ncbi:hypothetical protein [Nitrospirillum sp. BR 11828]|uniref:hypothetical protein n=1 Tax=Nitrospirillum sp. BR 11828 TaxID=3104325 RepID=UPI002ACAF138|nr:hypothetical protein [Nitrospirillum sp. BR 11828]MDZ5649250.1 hypothetical protein [Nitrospirillum sp. BR 11828]
MDIATMRAGVALGGDAIRIIGSWPALLTITLAIAVALRGLVRRRALIRTRRAAPLIPEVMGRGGWTVRVWKASRRGT